MRLPKGERTMVLAFEQYAMEKGDTAVKIKHFSKREEE